MTTETVEKLAVPQIRLDIERFLSRKARVLPHRSNWASDLADPCLRRLVYHRTVWDKQERPGPWLQGIFETGKQLERVILNNLNRIGEAADPPWELAAHAAPLNDKLLTDHQIGCAPDVFLKVCPEESRPQFLGPVDIKTSDPNVFRTINSLEDFDRRWYLRRYPAQVMTYAVAANYERGWLLVVNKSNLYEVKLIEIPLDYEYMESLLQKADTINAHVAAGTLPDQLNEPEECRRCAYAAHCCPPCATGGNLEFLDHDELEEVLCSLDELAATEKKINALKRQWEGILDEFKGQDFAVGEHIIQWKKSTGISKAKPATPWTRWNKTISRIGGAPDDADEFLETL